MLAGLPVGIKDLEATADMKTTYGSPFHDHIPDQDDLSVANALVAVLLLVKQIHPNMVLAAIHGMMCLHYRQSV